MKNQNFIPTLLFVSLVVCFVLLLHTTKQNALIIGELNEKYSNALYDSFELQKEIRNLEDYIKIIQLVENSQD